MLDSSHYLDSIRGDAHRIAELIGDQPANLDALVPACPGWSLRSLIEHLGGVHRMVIKAVQEQRPPRPGDFERGAGLGPTELMTWFRNGADRLQAALCAQSESRAWSFDPHGTTAGFWQRRQAMENAIHRVDVEQALLADTHIDPRLAADGVGEVIEVMIRLRQSESSLELPSAALELHAIDETSTWVIGEGTPVARVSATAADLFVALWKRAPADALTRDEQALRILELPLTP